MIDIPRRLARLALTFLVVFAPAAGGQEPPDPDPERELRALHDSLLRAHREGRVDLWMSVEADDFVSVNGGRVSFPDVETRRRGRASYLESTDFRVYRDLREPIVRVSDDGTVGWVIAEVRIAGSRSTEDGDRVPFDETWAWVELYEKTPDGWRLVGNASNRRPDEGGRPPPSLPVDTFALENGLRVVVSEDHSTPVVAVSMWYHVGSAHEPEGRRGAAHLFEHLYFGATANLEAGEAGRLVTGAGGRYDGSTNEDRTAFWEVVPAERLNLALWLHAERMARPQVSEVTLAAQRRTVDRERQLQVEERAYGAAGVTLDTLSAAYGPYRHPVLGGPNALEGASVEEIRELREGWYAPANAVLVVVGDVTVETVRGLVEEYFAGLEGGRAAAASPEPPSVPRRGPDAEERRATLTDPRAPRPLLWLAFSTPPAAHPDRYALELLSSVLAGSDSGRLVRRLVHEEGVASEVTSLLRSRLGPGTLRIGAAPGTGSSPERLEAALLEELEVVRTEGPTAEELEGALNRVRAGLVAERLTVRGKARALQSHLLHRGDAESVNGEAARYEAVTAADLRRVARTYLVPSNRTVVVVTPGRGGG